MNTGETISRRFGVLATLVLCAVLLVATAHAQEISGGQGTNGGGGGEPSSYWFAVDALNEGLGDSPDIGDSPNVVDRDTPQGTLETLLALVPTAASAEPVPGGPEAAARLLDLSDVPPARQGEAGPVLAQQLREVIARKVWIDWTTLPDRPDGLLANADNENPVAGEPRRSIRLALLDLDGRPVPIRLNRIKPRGSGAVWVFSRQTVANVPALYDHYGPTAFERGLPNWAKAQAVPGLAWWELIALPLVAITSIGAGVLVWRALKAIGARFPSEIVRHVFDALALPIAIIAATSLGFWVTGALFTFSAPIDAMLGPLLTVLLIAAALFAVIHAVDLVLDWTLTDDVSELEKPRNADRRRFQTNVSAARRVGLVIAFLAGAGLVLMQTDVFGGAGLTLLGSAGVLTLVLAYAGRTVLANIMASLQIAVSKSAKIGDAVLWQGQWCYVEKINFTYVQLKSWDKRRLIVPVSEFTSETFENWTKRDPSLTKVVELRLNHFADVERLRTRFFDWVDTRDDIQEPEACKVLVVAQDAPGMVVRFYVNAADPSTAWDMHCACREAMLRAAAELDPKGEHGGVVLPAEREVKIADLTEASPVRDAAE